MTFFANPPISSVTISDGDGAIYHDSGRNNVFLDIGHFNS